MSKAAEAFRTISEVASDLEVPKHVLRFWEAKFPQIRPMKRGGGRRYYRPEDMELLRGIRRLLHAEGYTIKGVQKILREQGVDFVKVHGAQPQPAAKQKGRGAVLSQPAANVPAALADSAAPKTGARKSATVAVTPVASLDSVIRSAIAELETCRNLLRGDVSAAEVAVPPQRARAARG